MNTKMNLKKNIPKSVRSALRQGWTKVEVPRTNLFEYNIDGEYFGNYRHFKIIVDWCLNTYENDTWRARIWPQSGVKKFAFKNQKDATMFILKWL